MPDVPRGRPDAPGDSGPYPRARGVDQLSRATPALVQRPEASTSSPRAPRARFRGTPVSTIGTGLFVPCPRVRVSTTSLGRLGPGPRARGVDQLLWAIPARVRGHTVSTSCPARRGPGSECPRRRPGVPCDSDPGPRALGVHQHSRETCARVRWPEVSTSSPGRLGPYPMARGVFELSRVTRDCAKGPRCRTALPGISRLPLRAPGVDQQARTTLARVRGPVKSTCGSG